VLGKEWLDFFTASSNGYYYIVGGWVLLSLPAWWRLRDPKRLLLILTLFYFSFMFGAVFIGDLRYHFALTPTAAVLASPAVVAVWDYVRSRKEAGLRGAEGTSA
jgi:hypothetical protein